MLRNARKEFQKSDESAYSIVPSRMSSRLSTSTNQGLSIDDNMSYRRLSFEDDLFTAQVYKRSYRTPFIRRLFQRKVQIKSDTVTIIGPERISGSKSADSEENLIDGDEADRQTLSPPRGHMASTDPSILEGELFLGNGNGRLEGFDALQPRPKIFGREISGKPENFDDVDNMESKESRIVMDLSQKHHMEKETLASWKELYSTNALAVSARYQGLEMLPEPNWAIGDDADAMDSTELWTLQRDVEWDGLRRRKV